MRKDSRWCIGCFGSSRSMYLRWRERRQRQRPWGPLPTISTTEPPLDLQAYAEGLLVGIESEGDFASFDSPGMVTIGAGSGIVISTDGLILTSATAVTVPPDRINVYAPGEEYPLVGGAGRRVRVRQRGTHPGQPFLCDRRYNMEEPAVPVAVADAERAAVTVERPTITSDGGQYVLSGSRTAGAGAVLFDADGVVAGVVTGFDQAGHSIALGAEAVAGWVDRMRNREVVEQLGFTVVTNTEGQAVVAAVAGEGPGAALGLAPGDVISKVDGADLVGGVEQLCSVYADGSADVEVYKEGRRYVGKLPDLALKLASSRTVEQIRQAVVEVNVPDWGTGSGFFISPDGLLVTNYHVVGSATDVELQFDATDNFITGEVVAASACSDLALIQAQAGEYQYLDGPPNLRRSRNRFGWSDFPMGPRRSPSRTVWSPRNRHPACPGWDRSDPSRPRLLSIGVTRAARWSTQTARSSGSRTPSKKRALPPAMGTSHSSTTACIWSEPMPKRWLPTRSMARVSTSGLARVAFTTGSSMVARYTVEVGEVRPGSPADNLGLVFQDEIVVFGDVFPQPDDSGFSRFCGAVAADEAKTPIDVVVWRWEDDSLWDGQLYGRTLSRRPDPYRLASADGSISAIVPGRWTERRDIEDDSNDWVGYWAAPDVDAYLNDFVERRGAAHVVL